MPHTPGHAMSAEMRKAINDCWSCHSACLEAVAHGTQVGGRHADAALMQLLLDCAEISQVAANFMLRGSDLYRRICEVCAEVAARCAQAVDDFSDDAVMKLVEEATLRCASSCKQMAAPAQVDQDEMSEQSFPASDPPAPMARG